MMGYVEGGRLTTSVPVTVLRSGRVATVTDDVVGEEPLEIRLGYSRSSAVQIGVIMRTPGHDFELAAGFLYSEGMIGGSGDVRTIRYCTPEPGMDQLYNIVTVAARSEIGDEIHHRPFTVNSSCGICGSATLEQLETRCSPLPVDCKISVVDPGRSA